VVVVVGSTITGVVVEVVEVVVVDVVVPSVRVEVSEVLVGTLVGGIPPPAVEHPEAGTAPLVW